MTSKNIDRLIELVKENNQRNNVEIITSLLTLKITLEKFEKEVDTLKRDVATYSKSYKLAMNEVAKLKKVIEILKDRFEIESVYKDEEYYVIDCKDTFLILKNQEEYDLLKEELENERIIKR